MQRKGMRIRDRRGKNRRFMIGRSERVTVAERRDRKSRGRKGKEERWRKKKGR